MYCINIKHNQSNRDICVFIFIIYALVEILVSIQIVITREDHKN